MPSERVQGEPQAVEESQPEETPPATCRPKTRCHDVRGGKGAQSVPAQSVEILPRSFESLFPPLAPVLTEMKVLGPVRQRSSLFGRRSVPLIQWPVLAKVDMYYFVDHEASCHRASACAAWSLLQHEWSQPSRVVAFARACHCVMVPP